MTIGPMPLCFECKHFRPDDEAFDEKALETHFYCAAFPDRSGIPFEIISGGVPHTEPYPGDNGIQYEPSNE